VDFSGAAGCESDAVITGPSAAADEGPVAPSSGTGRVTETAARHRINIPGLQKRETGATLILVWNRQRDRGHPPDSYKHFA